MSSVRVNQEVLDGEDMGMVYDIKQQKYPPRISEIFYIMDIMEVKYSMS